MKLINKSIITLFLLMSFGGQVFAYDLDIPDQSTFDNLARQAGTLITYRAMAPAEPGGWAGFDISIAASAVKIDSTLWDSVTPSDNISTDYVYVPSIRARKGLPFGFDVGASYSAVPGSDIQVLGGELQWALLDGSAATPALALRGHYSKLLNVADLDMTTYGADAVLSKGFVMFTPYIGIGAVSMSGDYTSPLNPGFSKFSETSPRYFGGLLMTITLLQITADIEYLEEPVYSLKLGIGW